MNRFNDSAFPHPATATRLEFIPPSYPSIRFGFETALADLGNGGEKVIFQNDFVKGKVLPINGLIWMGDMDFMM